VERGGEVEIPNGSFVLRTGDVISIVASRENTRDFVSRIGLKSRRVRDCLIIGGGKIAFYLAQQLIETGIRVKIIDFDPETNHAKLSLKAMARTHSRNRRKPVMAKASLPPMKIGFQSIASNMNQWIREAEKDLLKK
jgi:Trk K+ transport system NAD-binding subunit